MIDLSQYKEAIEDLCKTESIQSLRIFGSALTERFGPKSDVDILISFQDTQARDSFTSYFLVKNRLEEIFMRPVDLVIEKPFRNPFFQRSVDRSKQTVYERLSA